MKPRLYAVAAQQRLAIRTHAVRILMLGVHAGSQQESRRSGKALG